MTARPSRRAFLGHALAFGAGAVALAAGCSSNDPVATDAADGSSTGAPNSDGSGTAAPSPPGTGPDASTSTGVTTGPARFVDHGTSNDPQVALTFHTNGDLKLAQKVLDIVREHAVPITCFVIGNWLDANPSWGAKIRDAGHEVANHTYTHPDFTALSAAAMLGEVTKCRDALHRHAGDSGRFFRPSGTDVGTVDPGRATATAAGQAGYAIVAGFDVDPHDYEDPGAAAVTRRTLDAAKGGSIISLHFGHQGTVAALPDILDGLSTRRLTPVTLSHLVP